MASFWPFAGLACNRDGATIRLDPAEGGRLHWKNLMGDRRGRQVVRVRYAPSPTGTLHIGGARTALFNYLFALHQGGRFVLRLEDTDRARQVEGSEAAMMRGLASLGLIWDEGPDVGGAYGPYRQSERGEYYRRSANQLLEQGRAYRCFCTAQELADERERRRRQGLPPRYSGRCRALLPEVAAGRAADEPYVLRLAVPPSGSTVVDDLIRGKVEFENAQIDDFVLTKPDGTPVYNFAVVVDDAQMAITHVIRGEEHLSNTPKQMLVAEALGLKVPEFAHLPMILAPDRSKMSKRHGATSVDEYREQGILAQALANYLLLLGWSSPEGREFMSIAEAGQRFDLDRVQRTAAIYDQKKLEWMNGQYLRMLPAAKVAQAALPFVRGSGMDLAQGPALTCAVELVRERSRTLRELVDNMRFLYQAPAAFDPKGVQKYLSEPEAGARLGVVARALKSVAPWDHDHLSLAFDKVAAELGVKRALIIHPVRMAVTGKTVGPGLFEMLAALGPEKTIRQLERVARLLESGEGISVSAAAD